MTQEPVRAGAEAVTPLHDHNLRERGAADAEAGPSPSQLAASEADAAAVLQTLDALGAKVFFEKQLTSSDASGSGRVVIPKVSRAALRSSLH